MGLIIENHLLRGVRYEESPFFNERPVDAPLDLLVIHSICLPEELHDKDAMGDIFCNRLAERDHVFFQSVEDPRVSSHVGIARSGEVIQYVPFHLRAWHAGVSIYKGREACNDFSVGIELEELANSPYTDAQYQSLAQVIDALVNFYPEISAERMVGHSDISPHRKQDPGPQFHWEHLQSLIGREGQ